MLANLTFFPVCNGDMTLIQLSSGRTILIDVNIRASADDPDDETPDVATMLRKKLNKDANGRQYVDAFLLSHPDQDHSRGLKKHFHLGDPEEWSESANKIFIREIWSSPMVFRRASRVHNVLCEDANAFCCEARRRVKKFRETGGAVSDGDRILILGEDEDGKTDDLTSILVKVNQEFSWVNGQYDGSFGARLLAPQPKSEDEQEEEIRSKNHSSTILNISLASDGQTNACRFLTGGDAGVAIWERLWQRNSDRPDWLTYDILQAPHHCSWHSLSYDSWSEKGEQAKVCKDARSALSQAREGAAIVASSKAITDDDNDPPCIRAKREYEDITGQVRGSFVCVGDPKNELNPIEFEVVQAGPRLKTRPLTSAFHFSPGIVGSHPLPHGGGSGSSE